MSIKGLPVVKCIKCGKTSLKDEYEVNGCAGCASFDHGVDFGTYRRRESLINLGEGIHHFKGVFHKVGNLHYRNKYYYALIDHIVDEDGNKVTNHSYVADISPNSVSILKSMKPGTTIQFKAQINEYNKVDHKWGMSRMHHVMEVVNPI